MRRYWRVPLPGSMFRGAELMRLLVGVVMLVVLYMLIERSRDASMWRWLAPGDGAATAASESTPKPIKPETPLPAATGPTDEDSDQMEEAAQEFQAISDGTLRLGAEEMIPYNRLIEWVRSQSFARLWRRAAKGVPYTRFYDEAERWRGKLVALDLDVRVARDAGKNEHGVPLVEAWGRTDESGDRLYATIIVDCPKDMPLGNQIQEQADFVGYFLKLQGYEPRLSSPGQLPEKAPLLIGRLRWRPAPAALPATGSSVWTWLVGAAAVLALALAFGAVFARMRAKKRGGRFERRMPGTGEVIPIEDWLEQSGMSEATPRSNGREDEEMDTTGGPSPERGG